MDLSVVAGTSVPASNENGRPAQRSEDGGAAFELPIASEAEPPAASAQLPAGDEEAGEKLDLLELLAQADPLTQGFAESAAAVLAGEEHAAENSLSATAQQSGLILPASSMAGERSARLDGVQGIASSLAEAASRTASLLLPGDASSSAQRPGQTGDAAESPAARTPGKTRPTSSSSPQFVGDALAPEPRARYGASTQGADPLQGVAAKTEQIASLESVTTAFAASSSTPVPASLEAAPALATLAPAGPAASATPSASSSPSVPGWSATAEVTTPFGHANWASQFRDKVVWLVDRQQQSAALHIHPAHLGPVEVMLTIADDKTSIAFVSPHLAVRETIEASLAELRATLAERGLALGEAFVSADARDAREQLPNSRQPTHALPGGGQAAEPAVHPKGRVHHGLVDTFA